MLGNLILDSVLVTAIAENQRLIKMLAGKTESETSSPSLSQSKSRKFSRVGAKQQSWCQVCHLDTQTGPLI